MPSPVSGRQAQLDRLLPQVCRVLLRTSKVGPLLSTLCETLHSLPGYEYVRVSLHQPLVARGQAGAGVAPPLFWESHAMQGTRPLVQDDLGQGGDQRFGEWKSAVLIPLQGPGELGGCLAVYARARSGFAPEDITFLRELAHDLQESLGLRLENQQQRGNERFLTDLANLVPGLFYRLRFDPVAGLQFLYVSPGIDLLLPMSPSQLLRDPGAVFQALHPEDRRRFFRAGNKSREDLTVFNLEFRVVRPNGAVVWVLATAFPQWQDEAVVWTGLAIDVTPQNKLQQALQREQELLSVVLNNIGDGVVAIDDQDRLVLVNRTAVRMLDCPEDLVDVPWRELHPDLPWETPNRFRPWLKRRPDGTVLHLETHVSDLADPGQARRGRVMLLRDVTDRDRIEERLRQSEKLESIGLLAGGIAHDFNNLLTGLFGFIQLARMNAEHPDRVVSYLDHATGPFQRARTLTQQLLTFAKGGEIAQQLVNLGAIVPGILQAVLGDGAVRGTMVGGDAPWSTLANESQMHQVFENLFLNAKQAMPSGGEVRVSFRNLPSPGPLDRGLPARAYLQVVVEDTGPGLDPTFLSKVFDPFFTTKAGGTGLGLSICFSVLKKHGGVIEAENRPEGGARFLLLLPAEVPSPPTPSETEG